MHVIKLVTFLVIVQMKEYATIVALLTIQVKIVLELGDMQLKMIQFVPGNFLVFKIFNIVCLHSYSVCTMKEC